MNANDVLGGLVREIVSDPPMNHCADEGIWCFFCGERRKQVREYSREYEVKHKPDCWVVRAQAALARLDEGVRHG